MSAPLRQNLGDFEDALRDAGEAPGPWMQLIERVRAYVGRYTELERELLGAVDVRIPEHLLAGDLPEDPLEAAEVVAGRERERMGLAGEETGDVMRLLDREGLKVYLPPFPEGVPFEGFFLFDHEAGPLFVVDGRLSPPDIDHAFARLYGHFLFDHDPYTVRLLRRSSAEDDAAAVRTRAFAAAFLIPGDRLAHFLDAAGRGEGDAWERAVMDQLAVYFEVGYVPLLARLLALGYLTAGAAGELVRQLPRGGPPVVRERPRVIPERFVRLALERHARGGLEDDALAAHLESDRASALRLAARFRLEPAESEPTDPPADA